MLNTTTCQLKLPITPGWYQKSHGADSIWIMPSTSWLVLIDAHSKHPCIHPVSSTSTKATTELLEQDFAHFSYPHIHVIVTDNATSFVSEEFQSWCKRGITHLTGAPYHPATNGAAEGLVQTFKQTLIKSSLPPRAAVLEFLMQYRRSPLASGYSPSENLNGRQIRCKMDVILTSPTHIAQAKWTSSLLLPLTLIRYKTGNSYF